MALTSMSQGFLTISPDKNREDPTPPTPQGIEEKLRGITDSLLAKKVPFSIPEVIFLISPKEKYAQGLLAESQNFPNQLTPEDYALYQKLVCWKKDLNRAFKDKTALQIEVTTFIENPVNPIDSRHRVEEVYTGVEVINWYFIRTFLRIETGDNCRLKTKMYNCPDKLICQEENEGPEVIGLYLRNLLKNPEGIKICPLPYLETL